MILRCTQTGIMCHPTPYLIHRPTPHTGEWLFAFIYALPYTALDTLLSHCLVSSTALSVNTHLLPPTCTHRTPLLYGSGRISRRGGTGKLKYISRELKLDRLTFHYKLEGSVQIGCS